MSILVPIFVGIVAGFATKSIINWLSIDGFILNNKNFILELTSIFGSLWAFNYLATIEAFIFSGIYTILIGIALVDYRTFQIPLVFILVGIVLSIAGVIFNTLFLASALWGVCEERTRRGADKF